MGVTTHCRACHTLLVPFFNLGLIPAVNAFRVRQTQKQPKYPLEVAFCPQCNLAQLTHTVAPSILYRHYLYFSSSSPPILQHNAQTAEHLTQKLQLQPTSFLIEVASNDGALLQYFQRLHIPVLGIDPAVNVAKIANDKGVPTLVEFFSLSLAQKLRKQKQFADLIYGANILAHVPKIVPFIHGVELLLKPGGTAVFEFPYLLGLFEGKFDTIYHEHVFYYSLLALRNLLRLAKLDVYDIERISTQGGSLRIFVGRPSEHKETLASQKLLMEELRLRWNTLTPYTQISQRIFQNKKLLLTWLEHCAQKREEVLVYGAAAKGVVLINYFQCEAFVSGVIDKSTAKQNRYIPGTNLKIYSPEYLLHTQAKHLLITAWNVADDILTMPEVQHFINQGGHCWVSTPKLERIA